MQTVATCSALIFALGAPTVSAQEASPAAVAPAMPPGMTPAIMKMMMTPGPKHPKGLPKDVVPVDGCIPAMGYHYAKSGNWPAGPIYGYFNGKPIFTEIMVDKAKFEAGFDIQDALKPLPGYKIDHVDIWYEPHGHPGMTSQHYDIHAFYVTHAEHMKFCGNTSGKKPAFV